MAGSKHERDLDRAREARQQRASAQRSRRNRRLAAVVLPVLAILLVGAVALAVNDDEGTAPDAAPSSTPTSSGSDAATDGASADGVTCTEPIDDEPKEQSFTASDIDVVDPLPAGEFKQNLTTNCGDIVFTLDREAAPQTTRAMIFLTDRKNFYDSTSCHRLTTDVTGIWVLQCGDPTGTGNGGPGFELEEENLPDADGKDRVVYPRGTVAMANSGPGTTGSQFFIVYKDSPLPPDYTVVGEVEEGLDVVDHVAEGGTVNGDADTSGGEPKRPLQIQKMVASVSFEPTE